MLTTISISGINVIVFRDDLNHQIVSGNKLHKLAPNIKIAKDLACSTILSFGGPYSNHLHALAWVCNNESLRSIGVIRGELHTSLTPTLVDCERWGMQLISLSRQVYRQCQDELSSLATPCLASDLPFGQQLTTLDTKNNILVVPEGGSNLQAIDSLTKAYREVFDSVEQLDVTHAICATGTGATVAGLHQAAPSYVEVIGIQAVAEQEATLTRIRGWLRDDVSNLTIKESHLGRFGKITPELTAFMDEFESRYNIPIDPIYTAKAMYKLVSMIKNGYFKQNETILFIHTGGLQGKRSH